MKFSGICLVTDDVLRLAAFYERIFQTEAAGDGNHAEVWAGSLSLAIFSVDGMEKMAPGSMLHAATGRVTLGFEVDDVDAAYNWVSDQGANVVKLPETHPWGARSFWFRDPDGNIIDFWMRIGNPAA